MATGEAERCDFVVVGGGAAGFFGAIAFAEDRPGSRVVILEKSKEPLQKVRISGGGRCNVTHACYDPRALTAHYPRGEKSLIGPFHRFSTVDTISWFESRGVELKVESDGRMFPETDDSGTVIGCLRGTAESLGIELRIRSEVGGMEPIDSGWEIRMEDGSVLRAPAALVATGGIRNGAGARLGAETGHEVIPAAPSLFTFRIEDERLDGLAGVSVEDVGARVEKTGLRSSGPCLVTHWGLSGPAILKLSAWGARELAERDYRFEIVVNWCGDENENSVRENLREQRESSPKRRVSSGGIFRTIPARLWKRMVEAAGISREQTWSNLGREQREALVRELVAARYRVDGKSMNKDEFVTAGGIDLREVDFRTLESRRCSGLYFAGEVLDIDGVTGGFNFQAAWTTGYLAGKSAAAAANAIPA